MLGCTLVANDGRICVHKEVGYFFPFTWEHISLVSKLNAINNYRGPRWRVTQSVWNSKTK